MNLTDFNLYTINEKEDTHCNLINTAYLQKDNCKHTNPFKFQCNGSQFLTSTPRDVMKDFDMFEKQMLLDVDTFSPNDLNNENSNIHFVYNADLIPLIDTQPLIANVCPGNLLTEMENVTFALEHPEMEGFYLIDFRNLCINVS
jgi:hypothetical protein